VKKSTGELRLMHARTGVWSHLRGGPAAYDAAEKGLITLFDMDKRGYRSIPVANITRLKVGGVWQDVTEQQGELFPAASDGPYGEGH